MLYYNNTTISTLKDHDEIQTHVTSNESASSVANLPATENKDILHKVLVSEKSFTMLTCNIAIVNIQVSFMFTPCVVLSHYATKSCKLVKNIFRGTDCLSNQVVQTVERILRICPVMKDRATQVQVPLFAHVYRQNKIKATLKFETNIQSIYYVMIYLFNNFLLYFCMNYIY